MLLRLVQLPKAPELILVIESGIATLVRFLQFINA